MLPEIEPELEFKPLFWIFYENGSYFIGNYDEVCEFAVKEFPKEGFQGTRFTFSYGGNHNVQIYAPSAESYRSWFTISEEELLHEKYSFVLAVKEYFCYRFNVRLNYQEFLDILKDKFRLTVILKSEK